MLHTKPEHTPLCDLALIERVKAGDQNAYKALYELHIKRVYGLCSVSYTHLTLPTSDLV